MARKTLNTVRQHAEHYPSFTEAALRKLIFNAEENGFARVLVRVGRRIYIDESEFVTWIESKKETKNRHDTKAFEPSCDKDSNANAGGAEIARQLVTTLENAFTDQEIAKQLFEAFTNLMPTPIWDEIDAAIARIDDFSKTLAPELRLKKLGNNTTFAGCNQHE